MFKPSTTVRKRTARVALALLACIAMVGPFGRVAANAEALAASPGPTLATGRLVSTGRAQYVDLATTPFIRSQPVRQTNYPRNNISFGAFFAAQRAAALTKASLLKPPAGTANLTSPLTVAQHNVNVVGINQSIAGGYPPDGDIAVNRSWAVHLVNFDVTTYTKSGVLYKRTNLATFFHNSTDFIFDSRGYWDQYYDRFIIVADGLLGSGSTQQSFVELAVSTSNNPNGGYYIYRFAVTGAGDFFDFPQMGADQDAIILTGNDFTASGGFDAKVFALSKARMYTGAGTNFSIFGGIGCTVAPPQVLDNNDKSFIMAACANDNKIYLGALTNSSRAVPSLALWQAVIPVPAYSIPATAPQPGINYPLETGFNSFEQRSYQLGSRIWNVHTIQDGTATPKWYEFDTASNTLVSSGIWYASGTSSDWHGSIVANLNGDVYGTWMSVDAPQNKNISVHYIGGSGNSAGFGAGSTLFTSTQPLTGQTFQGRNRSGDYSGIALDPTQYGSTCAPNRRVWIEGETVFGANLWGTQIGEIGNC